MENNLEALSRKVNKINRDIQRRSYGKLLMLAVILLVIASVIWIVQRQQDLRRISAALTPTPFTYTFDGDPSAPQSKYWMDDFDVQVHSGGPEYERKDNLFDTMQAAHGPDCGAPPASHTINTAQDAVFNCKNHIMTAISGGYALVYLQPDRILDWSDGEATLSFDISTFRTSGRDWWDLWLTEWDKQATVPLGDRFGQAGVALNGPPIGDYFHVQLMEQNFFRAESESGEIDRENTGFSNSSATQRDKFILTIRKSGTFDFCKPDENVCFFKDRPHGLSVNQAVVQLGHHTYDPAKSCNITDCHDDTDTAWKAYGTWHWDNLHLSDSIPYTVIRGDKRSVGQPWYGNSDTERTVTFPVPAPANSYLKFETGAQDTRVNGVSVQPIIPYWTDHPTSYFVPIPEGTNSFVFSSPGGCNNSCLWRGFSIVSRNIDATSNPSPPTSTPVPTVVATSTPIPPTVAVPTTAPTAIPTAVPTSVPTATPVVSAQSALSLSPVSSTHVTGTTFTSQVRVNTSGQTVNAVDIGLTYPTSLLDVVSISNGSDFEIEAERTASNGTITLAYGTSTPKSGDLLVATITFRAKASGVANVNFTASSEVISNVSNSDVLASRTNGTYTLIAPTPTPTNTPTPTPIPQLTGDLNNDQNVDVQDLSYLLSKWRTTDTKADLNGDGAVNAQDLSILLSNWTG